MITIPKSYRYQLCLFALAIGAIFCPCARADTNKLPRLVSRDRLVVEDSNQKFVKSVDRAVKSIENSPLLDRKSKPYSQSSHNNYWYAGASTGVTFLGDINLTQRFDPFPTGVSQFNLQLRNLGDILSGLEQSQFAEIFRASLLEGNSESSGSVTSLTPQQAGELFNQLANNPASTRTVLQQSGISPQTFTNLVVNSSNILTQPQSIERLPANVRNTPAKIARLNQLGQDLNLLGQLLRRAQTPETDRGNNGQIVENRSQVRTSSGIGLGTFVGYKFVDFRLEAELFYSSNTVNKVRNSSPLTSDVNTEASGNIANTTIAINGYYDLPVNWQIKPFIGAGIGFSYLSSSSLDLGGGQVVQIDRQPLFTYQLKAGFSLPVAERTNLFVQYRYLNTAGFTSSGSLRGIPVSNTIDGINLQSLEIGAKFGL